MKRALFAVLSAGLFATCVHAAPIFQLTPSSGIVSGVPGSTVGWGFTLTNTSNFLVVTGASFTPASLYGTFQDYISAFNFVVVGPAPESSTVTQSFSSVNHSGVGSFIINSTAPTGISIAGSLVLEYSVFSVDPNDPNFNPDIDTVIADATASAPADVNIAPEPASLFLTIAAALFLIGMSRRAVGPNS